MAQFTLRLFGTAECRESEREAEPGGGSLAVIGPGKPLALLTFLHATGHEASREQLVDLLWADVPPESGRHTLRQTLWYVRKRLGGQPLSTEGNIVRLVVPFASDRADFLQAVESSDAERAFQVYTGDFFPGFASPGAAAFEQWADLERQRLRTLYIGAAGRLVRTRLEAGRARDALVIARRARDLAPDSQSTWRMVLESLAAAGDFVGAKAEAERLTAELSVDDLEPEPATQQLLRMVATGRPFADATVDPRAIAVELVGRDKPFSTLLQAYARAEAGHPCHVHVSAPAGLGKTRLLQGVAARLRSQRGTRPRVIATRATPAERSMPYAFAGQLVTALVGLRGAAAVSPDSAATLLALAPAASTFLSGSPDRSTGDEAMRRRALAMIELVTAVADDAPLVLLVDDVHWMDAQSRTLLAALAERMEHGRVLLVTTGRGADAFAELAPRAERLPLTPLGVDDVLALIVSVASLPAEPWAELFPRRLQVATGGSPLLITETLQLAIDREHLLVDNSVWHCDDPNALLELLGTGHALQQRVGALPSTAHDVLLALALAGEPLNEDTLRRVLGVEVAESATLLETRGLAVRMGDSWRPAHDEIAAITVDAASSHARATIHTALAVWLETQPMSPNTFSSSRALWHRFRAGDVGALDSAARRFVELVGAAGDRALIAERLRDALGPDVRDEDIQALLGRLPRRLRRPSSRRIPTLLAGGALAGLALVASRRPPVLPPPNQPDVTLVTRVQAADGHWRWVRLAASLDAFGGSVPLDVSETIAPLPEPTLDSLQSLSAIAFPSVFAGTIVRTDRPSLAMDVMQRDASGRITPLVSRPYDQAMPTPSPDGRYLVFLDRGHWPSQAGDLFLLDLRTGREHRLTSTPDEEKIAVWSPNGREVAFVRESADSAAMYMCRLRVDEPQTKRVANCQAAPVDHIPTGILSWRNDERLLLTAVSRRTGLNTLVMWTPGQSGAEVLDEGAALYEADALGQLVLCQCRVPGYDGLWLAAFTPEQATRKRPLRLDGRLLTIIDNHARFWSSLPSAPAAVRIVAPDTMVLGGEARLNAVASDARGRDVAVPLRRWLVLDTARATVDSTGLLRTYAAGPVRVALWAGGQLADTTLIQVRAPSERVVMHETFSDSVASKWFRYGEPLPTVVRGTQGSVLRPNGDERLHSGAVSREFVDGRRGAGVRVRFRLPLNRRAWQNLSVAIEATASDSLLQWWQDHPDEPIPVGWSWRTTRSCLLTMPRAEGFPFLSLLGLRTAGQMVATSRIPPSFGDGAVHEVQLEVNPDGRCSFMLDGVLLGVSENAMPLDRPLRVHLAGQSVRTTVEVLEVEFWEGMKARPSAPKER